MRKSITVSGNQELYKKYNAKKDGNYIYFDDVDDDPNITIEIEDIVRDSKEKLFEYLIKDFGEKVFDSPRVIIYQ